VASISFDDFPKSAWSLGGQVLARHEVHGTYYTGGQLLRPDRGGYALL
jgi:hypothetical protein